MSQVRDYVQLLRCPRCSGKIQHQDPGLQCADCAQPYDIDDGIPLMFCPNDWEERKRDVTEEESADGAEGEGDQAASAPAKKGGGAQPTGEDAD